MGLVVDPDEILFRDEYTVGLVGVGLLSAFRLVLDYPRSPAALIPLPGEKRRAGGRPGPTPGETVVVERAAGTLR